MVRVQWLVITFRERSETKKSFRTWYVQSFKFNPLFSVLMDVPTDQTKVWFRVLVRCISHTHSLILGGQSITIDLTSRARMSTLSQPKIVLKLGCVLPKSPWTNSLTYVPA